jgi:hypothetical protein
MFQWLDKNKEWLFSGAGIAILSVAAALATSLWDKFTQAATETEKVILSILLTLCVAVVGVILFLFYQSFRAYLDRENQKKQLDSLADSIERISRGLEVPRRFENWDQAQPEIKRLIHSSLKNADSIDIRCLGVALHVSWKTVRECVEEYQRDHGKFPKAVIRLKVLSPEWDSWDKLGRSWQRRNEVLFESVAEFRQAIRGNPNIKLELFDYVYPPNWHGVLINEQHLFRSSCLYRDNEFTVHKNPYVYFRREANYYSDMQISEFLYWFNHEAHLRTPMSSKVMP